METIMPTIVRPIFASVGNNLEKNVNSEFSEKSLSTEGCADVYDAGKDEFMEITYGDIADGSSSSPASSEDRMNVDDSRLSSESSTSSGSSSGGNAFRADLKRPDLKGTFRCSICSKVFCHSSSLSRHRMQAHFKSYKCTLCRKDITSNETLRAHMYKQHQISRMFMCRCCNWAFPDKTSLHMHIQAREEGKSVSVPVIGKGMTTDGLAIETTSFAPLLQINNNNNSINNNNNLNNNNINNNNNNSNSSHVVSAINGQALSAPTPATALPFFSAVAPPPTLTSGGDELGRLRERIMINQLMNQHAFNNTFSWLNQLPKPIPTTRPLDLSHTNDADEDLVINVEKDIDSPKPDDDDEKLNISISDSEDPKSEGTKRTNSPCENACTSSTVGSSPSHTGSLPSPVNHFKKSRTSPSAFHHLNVDSRAFVSVSSPSHVSPSETNSSISPDGQNRPACYECALYKTKLTMADNKCRYLESRANTLQGETVRAQTQTAAAETAIRVLENETRNLRDHTENIQRKLLDCQEQALRFVQSDKTGNQQAVVLFLNQLIQSTIIR